MSETGAAVRTESLTKTYGHDQTLVRALDAVSVEIHGGEFTAVMGPSGSGKSTLMHLTAGLDAATSGRSWIGDVEITALDDTALTLLRRERVGFVFQSFNLLPTLDARANILLPLKLANRKPEAAWFDQVVDVLGIGDRLTHRPGELSGGQQQRVAAARALITKPDVIFADEPTGALDSASSEQLLTFLRDSVTELGQTIVMVTHDANAAAVADLPGIDRVRAIADVGVAQVHGGSISYFALMTPPEPGERTRVTEGRLPTAPGEAAVNTVASDLRGWRVGDTITLDENPVLEFRLTGIVDAGSVLPSIRAAKVPPAAALALGE